MPRIIQLAAALPAPPDRLFDMYMDPAEHAAFTGAPVVISPRAGARFRALVYLMGGEHEPLDVLDYPTLGKRYLLVSTPNGTEFYELADPSKPFGPA